MKKETKELINWAIDHFQHYKIDIHTRKDKFNFGTAGTEREFNYSQDIIAFLRKLPEIESHLCRGGYIQDKNGTPCCDGDKILFCGEYNGILRFGFMDDEDKKSASLPHFWFDFDFFGGKVPVASDSNYFEKVEK